MQKNLLFFLSFCFVCDFSGFDVKPEIRKQAVEDKQFVAEGVVPQMLRGEVYGVAD